MECEHVTGALASGVAPDAAAWEHARGCRDCLVLLYASLPPIESGTPDPAAPPVPAIPWFRARERRRRIRLAGASSFAVAAGALAAFGLRAPPPAGTPYPGPDLLAVVDAGWAATAASRGPVPGTEALEVLEARGQDWLEIPEILTEAARERAAERNP